MSRHLSAAASFLIEWDEQNQRHPVLLEIADTDGQILGTVTGEVEAGRPPGVPIGQPQRVQLAAELGMRFVAAGQYVITARVADREPTTFHFYVVAGPGLARSG
jgi:hypothetical protein